MHKLLMRYFFQNLEHSCLFFWIKLLSRVHNKILSFVCLLSWQRNKNFLRWLYFFYGKLWSLFFYNGMLYCWNHRLSIRISSHSSIIHLHISHCKHSITKAEAYIGGFSSLFGLFFHRVII